MVVIIALISGTGAGLYVGTFRKLQVERAAYDFLLAAKYARLMAIEQQKQYKMELDLATQGFYLTTVLLDENGVPAGQEMVKNFYCKPVQFEGEVQFEAVEVVSSGWETESEGEEVKTIVFLPNGTSQSAVVQIGNGTVHYAISISAATGRAKMFFSTAENVKVGSTDLDEER